MLREKGEESIHRAISQSDELINCCVGAKNTTKYMDPVESFRAANICGDGIMVELVLLQLLSRLVSDATSHASRLSSHRRENA